MLSCCLLVRCDCIIDVLYRSCLVSILFTLFSALDRLLFVPGQPLRSRRGLGGRLQLHLYMRGRDHRALRVQGEMHALRRHPQQLHHGEGCHQPVLRAASLRGRLQHPLTARHPHPRPRLHAHVGADPLTHTRSDNGNSSTSVGRDNCVSSIRGGYYWSHPFTIT